MLDAAHGKSVGAVIPSERLDVALFETQETGVRMARCVGGRRPRKAADADISKAPESRLRSPAADVGKQSLEWMPRRGKQNNSQFTIMASISRRLFLIRKTLRPGPARIKDATPTAGPGEHTKNEYCRLIDSSASPQNDELLLNCALIPLRGLDSGCALDGLRLGHARTSSE